MSDLKFIDPSAEKASIQYLCEGKPGAMEGILERFPDIRPDWFTSLAPAWNAACDIHGRGETVSSLTLVRHLDGKGTFESVGGASVITAGSECWAVVEDCLARLQALYVERKKAEICKRAGEGFLTIAQTIVELEPLAIPAGTLKLKERRFDLLNPPAEAIPRLYLAGQGVSTAGNLTVITGQAKAGKSALLGGTVAALIDGKEHLGMTAPVNTAGHGWIHFDTEQSRYDHHRLICRAMERAGVNTLPEWFRSYSLADVPTAERRKLLAAEMVATKAAHGKLEGVIIDGIADLCHDLNDPAEAFGLVEELQRLAIKFDCVIVVILHLNPSTLTGKTRGHLGSQLERKAESVIQLEKDKEGVVTTWLGYGRNSCLPKVSGIRFKWDDDEGMFMQVAGTRSEERAKAKDDAKRAELTALAHLVIDRNGARKWGDFIGDLVALGSPKKTAERKFTLMKQLSIISQTLTGEWEIAA